MNCTVMIWSQEMQPFSSNSKPDNAKELEARIEELERLLESGLQQTEPQIPILDEIVISGDYPEEDIDAEELSGVDPSAPAQAFSSENNEELDSEILHDLEQLAGELKDNDNP